MALTLSPELAAVQTAQSRKPIIELIAGRFGADYPFLGNSITNPDSTKQGASLSLFLNDGRLAMLYAGYDSQYENDLTQLRMVVTNADVSEFTPYVVVDTDISRKMVGLDGFVMADGNIGLVAQLSSDVLALYVISPTGAKISESQITSLGTLYGATVCQTATGYALVYARKESSTYTMYLATSTDFISWGAPAAISITGLDSAHPLQDPVLKRLADGTYTLLYSYATVSTTTSTIFNLQYATSSDLTSWGTSAAITNTSSVSEDYVAPSVVQREDGALFIAIQESATYLTMKTASVGWNTTNDIKPTNMWVDSAAGKLYVTAVHPSAGAKALQGMCRIDLDTWTIDRFYGLDTTPPIPACFSATAHCIEPHHNCIRDGYATIHNSDSGENTVAVVDYNSDTIRTYYFNDRSGAYGEEANQNVTHDVYDYQTTSTSLRFSDIHDGKLWLGFFRGYLYEVQRLVVGYIDLTQTTAPYEFVTVNTTAGAPVRVTQLDPKVFFYPGDGLALVCNGQLSGYDAPLHVLSLNEDVTVKCYRFADYPSFPNKGVTNACLVGGDTIYATTFWDTTFAADADKWGLMEINLNTDTIKYYQPPWKSSPGNYLGNIVVNESANELYFRTYNGVYVFNYLSKTWEQIENTVIDGLPPTDTQLYHNDDGIAYDPVRQYFFYGDEGEVYLVPRYGSVTSIKYITESQGAFSAPATLVTGYRNVTPSLVLDADDVLYASWTNSGIGTVQWDKAAARLELEPYLTGETSIEWALDAPGRLKFNLSHGHLFDPHNTNSLLRPYLLKGKGVTVRMGENVGGVNYWAEQGTYMVRQLSIRHQRESYPTIDIVCEDRRSLWEDHQVVVADVDMQTPENALVNVITNFTDILSGEIIVPTMPLSFSFDAQWIDSYLTDIVDDIAHRFQHFCAVDQSGNIAFRPITFNATSSNTYQLEQIIEYSPDDNYSDMTNRITVTGESLHDFQITHEEERLASLNGTVGWWGFKKDYTLYYSEDESKRAMNPRLEVVETSTGILFKLAGDVTEKISHEDPDHKYCVVEVKAPNLVPILASAIALYAAGNQIGDGVVGLGGTTIPIGRKMEGVGLLLGLMVLGSVGNFQYEVWGNPVGYIKRSYEASADDTELQQEIGMVVEARQEGFLCHTPGQCQTVADFEMTVTKAQRSRVNVKKTTHLQDEIGDTVTIPHPYTGQQNKVFLTNIIRKYKPPVDRQRGHVLDLIEGWVL